MYVGFAGAEASLFDGSRLYWTRNPRASTRWGRRLPFAHKALRMKVHAPEPIPQALVMVQGPMGTTLSMLVPSGRFTLPYTSDHRSQCSLTISLSQASITKFL